MKKQQFSASLALALMIFSSLLSTPAKVNAGQVIIQGTTEDSGTASGDNFSPNNSQLPIEVAPGVNVEFSNGSLNISSEVQSNLNEIVTAIQAQNPEPNSPLGVILTILQGGLNAEQAVNSLQAALNIPGVSQSSVKTLVRSLFGLATNQSASKSNLPSSVKNLIADSTLAQKEGLLNIDVNRLNLAISAYNQIVMESSPEVLQKLAKNPEFIAIGKLLKELRTALNKS